MFELFMERLKSNQGTITVAALPSIKQEFKKSINRVMNYYRDSDFFVDNDHLLVKLLKTLPTPQGDDVRRWYYQAQDLSEGIAGLHGIINAQNSRANVSQKLFLGGVGEILIEISRPITMNLKTEDWLNTDSIICLYHPYTDMRVRPLDGEEFQRPIMGDHAVIGIDIALLYVQYHLWRREIAPKIYKEGKQPSIHKWVYQYPLVTALKSYLDMSMFNRFICFYSGIEPTKVKERAKIPTNYVDYTDKIDECLKGQIALLKAKQLSYSQILVNIPLLLKNNAFEFFHLDSAYVTHQIRWCYLAARLDVIKFLMGAGDLKINGSDRYYDDKWRYGIRNIRGEFVNTYPSTPLLNQKVKELASLLK